MTEAALAETDIMARKKRPGRKTKTRAGLQISVYVDPELRRVVDEYIAATEPDTTLTAVVELALRRFLASLGRWPPPDPESETA